MTVSQLSLFDTTDAQPADARLAEALPDGFRYQPEFVTERDEESEGKHHRGDRSAVPRHSHRGGHQRGQGKACGETGKQARNEACA